MSNNILSNTSKAKWELLEDNKLCQILSWYLNTREYDKADTEYIT